MTDLLALWPWLLGALGVAGLVGVVLSPVSALRLAKEFGEFVLERARGFVAWLREPRDWWRFIAVCLGVVCLGAAFAVRDAQQQVLVVREQCATQIVTIEGKAKQANDTAQANARALQVCRLALEDEVGKAQSVQKLAEQAVAAAKRDADAAQASMTAWRREYSRRPATCESALQALEAACPTITDY